MLRCVAGAAVLMLATASSAQPIKRVGPDAFPISASVEVPAGSRLVYVSGTVPDAVETGRACGHRSSDSATPRRRPARSSPRSRRSSQQHGLAMGDVVMMRVFLVAPPGQQRMDFAGMMRGYRAFFGTTEQPHKPARSTMQVAGLVDPGWLVEIEVTAAHK